MSTACSKEEWMREALEAPAIRKLSPVVVDDEGRPVVRLRCLTPKCRWVGYLRAWVGGPCPRCGGDFAVYA